VFVLLSAWAENPDRYYWVITRSLSRSWAASHPNESLAILTHLAEIKGGRKKILNALKALQSHGAKTEVLDTLQQWRTSDQPQLQSAAQKAEEKGL
jgi:sugar diacid utilization regulator